MIKKLTTLIMIISLFSAYIPASVAYDVRIAQVDEAFSPASNEPALEKQAEELPAAQKRKRSNSNYLIKRKKRKIPNKNLKNAALKTQQNMRKNLTKTV